MSTACQYPDKLSQRFDLIDIITEWKDAESVSLKMVQFSLLCVILDYQIVGIHFDLKLYWYTTRVTLVKGYI